jgi:hypothetical protein
MVVASGSASHGPSGFVRASAYSRTVRLTQRQREHAWAWLSLLTLLICWDASLRLDERVSIPRARIAHAADASEASQQTFDKMGQ